MTRHVCPVCADFLPCACPPGASLDTRALRNAFGRFATGITVVTALAPDGRPVGMTVNSFSSVSLEPPLLLWCLGNSASEFATYRQAGYYCINILTAEQRELSERFASRNADRFAGIAWQPGVGGVPVLSGCAANFEVRNEVQHPAGDHHIMLGRVERFRMAESSSPLLFHAGGYAVLTKES